MRAARRPVVLLQEKLLKSAAIFRFDGSKLQFESRTSETYARDILPGKISPDIKI